MIKSYLCIDRQNNSCLNTDAENRTFMTEKQKKEYADTLKDGAKELLDCIGTDDELGQSIVKLIYCFTRSGFKEYGAGRKAVRHE